MFVLNVNKSFDYLEKIIINVIVKKVFKPTMHDSLQTR
jgi:hypothetical protein